MSEFQLYFGLGREHILDYANGYDHILFVLALCAIYIVKDWRHIIVLITAFTIGHSITLALATLNIISVDAGLVEFLIPLTIFLTAVTNLFGKDEVIPRNWFQANYFLALFFGLIHGMGFSNYLRALLGKDERIFTQLLAFNLGLEFGQIIIVGIFLAVCFIAIDLIHINRRDWKMVLSSAIAGMAFLLMKDRL